MHRRWAGVLIAPHCRIGQCAFPYPVSAGPTSTARSAHLLQPDASWVAAGLRRSSSARPLTLRGRADWPDSGPAPWWSNRRMDGRRRMRFLRWTGQRDRDFAALRRAGRTAVVMPGMFAVGAYVIGNPQVATFGAFGAFAMLLLVDFGGPLDGRLKARAACWSAWAPWRRSTPGSPR